MKEKFAETSRLLSELGSKNDASAREKLFSLWPNGMIGPGIGGGHMPHGVRVWGEYLVVSPSGVCRNYLPGKTHPTVPYSPPPEDSARLYEIAKRIIPTPRRKLIPSATRKNKVFSSPFMAPILILALTFLGLLMAALSKVLLYSYNG